VRGGACRPIEMTANYCYGSKNDRTFLVCKKWKKKSFVYVHNNSSNILITHFLNK